MKRRTLLSFLATLSLSSSYLAHAQSPAKIPRIGFLTAGDADATRIQLDRLHQALRELGYIEGKNVLIENKKADWHHERLDDLAKELVGLKVDVIVTANTSPALSAQRATKTIPIVVWSGDPVRAGLVDSLARPGGNITGITSSSGDLSRKRLELLKEISPNTSVVGIVADVLLADPGIAAQMKNAEAAAQALGLRLIVQQVQGDDYESAFAEIKRRADSLFMILSTKMLPIPSLIADLAAKSGLPAVYPNSDQVDAGGLISYGTNRADLYRRLAYQIDRILKGAKPADLPVEAPTKFELVVNLKAAKQIGLTIPESVLQRADRIIPDK